jgi:hypothetical protein
MDPYQRLAAEIITQAKGDLKKAIRGKSKCEKKIEMMKKQGEDDSIERFHLERYKAVISEVMNFFTGDWCEGFCDMLNWDRDAVLDGVRRGVLERVR